MKIPSGYVKKAPQNYRVFMGKLTISMDMFNSYVSHFQRLLPVIICGEGCIDYSFCVSRTIGMVFSCSFLGTECVILYL